MSIQVRFSEHDKRLYNVNRDVAHNFGDVVREVADRLEDGRWPAVDKFLKEKNVSLEELAKACQAFCIFVADSTSRPKETMRDCLTRCGWFDVREEAQIAYMAILGTVVSGYFWSGVREATIDGEGPTLTLQDLRERGRESSRLFALPSWKKWLYKIMYKVKLFFHLLFYPSSYPTANDYGRSDQQQSPTTTAAAAADSR